MRKAVVSEVIDFAPDRIRVRLILTDAVPAAKIEEARKTILRRTRGDVDLFVRKAAGEEELALLRKRLKPAPPTPIKNSDGVRRELVARLELPLHVSWPAGSATLFGYESGFSAVALDEAAAAVLRNVFRSRLHIEQLRVERDWVPPEPPPPPVKKNRASRKAVRR